MNILVDTLPTSVNVEGVDYPVNSDFRACLRSILAFEDPDIEQNEKIAILLTNLFMGNIPEDTKAALKAATWFMNCGEERDEDDDIGSRVFSFDHDARFIFAAFKQTHNIDLNSADLHFWKFIALFMDLGQDTTFCQLASLRKRIKSGKATKEEIKAANELGDLFDLDDYSELSIKERENIERFNKLAGIE